MEAFNCRDIRESYCTMYMYMLGQNKIINNLSSKDTDGVHNENFPPWSFIKVKIHVQVHVHS